MIRLGAKLVAIFALTCVILIALFMDNGVISERQDFRNDAIHSIEASYAGPQTLIGPVMVFPYTQTVQAIELDAKGLPRSVSHQQSSENFVFPHDLTVVGKLMPTERRHGLYKVTVYEFQGEVLGDIAPTSQQSDGTTIWGQPYLALSVADVRGIVGTPQVEVNGVSETMVHGSSLHGPWHPNLEIPINGVNRGGQIHFDLKLDLAGTEQFSVAPVGDSNHMDLTSAWSSPLFDGQFLPRSRSVSSDGFKATWDVSSLASATQMQMQTSPADSFKVDRMNVSLLTPIDPYKLSDRATKYGILFVLLTFGGFFLFELMTQLPIHPVQYLLVGLALAVFFLLLISFSEHIPFGVAYLLSSLACIGLLTFYLSYVLHNVQRGLVFGGMLAAVYAAVYGLLISQDNALILGSVLLFAVLAAVMIVTRNVDWYRGSAGLLNASRLREAASSVTAAVQSQVPPPVPPA